MVCPQIFMVDYNCKSLNGKSHLLGKIRFFSRINIPPPFQSIDLTDRLGLITTVIPVFLKNELTLSLVYITIVYIVIVIFLKNTVIHNNSGQKSHKNHPKIQQFVNICSKMTTQCMSSSLLTSNLKNKLKILKNMYKNKSKNIRTLNKKGNNK